jgi:hypothetical protein
VLDESHPRPSTSATISETVASGTRNENERGSVSTEEQTGSKRLRYGDIFPLNIEEAREALSCSEDVTSIFLTKPWKENDHGVEKQPFLTAWLSLPLGDRISEGKEKLP